jgi:hypothetical protein
MNHARGGPEGRQERAARPGRSGGRLRPALCLLGLWAGALGLLGADGAQAQSARAGQGQAPMHEVTWAHATPARVARFVIYVSPAKARGRAVRRIDVGKPQGQLAQDGSTRVYSAIVPAAFEEFIAVAAVATDGREALSDWAPPPPGQPGRPLLVDP